MGPSSTVELHTGNLMPVIGIGTWQMGSDATDALKHAIKIGYRMIDTSGDYGTQPAVGKAFKKSGIPRGEMYIVTKIEEDDNAYEAAKYNVRKMHMEYADLILIHRPPRSSAGQDLWNGLAKARDEGIVKDIGVSNYSIGEMQELISESGITPVVNQIEWTPFGHSVDMLDFCRENDIIIQAYSPLTREERINDEQLRQIARSYGKTPEQVMLKWCLQLGAIPIPKASNPNHQQKNLDIFDFIISDDDMASLNSLNEEYSALNSLQYV